ncbi:helix-turn-helix transcriptional regulator [Aquimarina sp. AU474]|uniref:AraC family transcriptional regulator n=1 Tax=Aquimarina sp. AU474 TaxID=2108529 RepID=UPI000D6867F2|nr:helix-turn-helix transcriptional regulator [Aquimarina sp. AU474]
MSQKIPYIHFESNESNIIEGIEIITIESIFRRKHDLDHYPEKAHQLDFYMLVFYTQGETEHLVDFVWHPVRANTLLYLAKGQINAFRFEENVKGFVILFTEEYFKSQLNKLPKNAVIRLFTSHLFSPIIQIPLSSNVTTYIDLFYDEFYKEKGEFNKKNIIDSIYTVIFSKLEQLKQYQTFHLKESDKLASFLEFKSLVEQYFVTSRNADFYAKEMYITYKHLNTICKEIVDSTAKSFIDEFVILEAKRRLVNSTVKSNELAFQMGFNEPTNFVKYFKKFTNLTPNAFKKRSY